MQYQRFDSHPLVAAPCVQNTCQIRPSTQNSLRSGQIKCSAEGAQDQTINTKQPGADLTKRLGQIKWSATVAQDQVIHAERHTEGHTGLSLMQTHRLIIHAQRQRRVIHIQYVTHTDRNTNPSFTQSNAPKTKGIGASARRDWSRVGNYSLREYRRPVSQQLSLTPTPTQTPAHRQTNTYTPVHD
eukprot:1160563-Pelagomonas_calceolata.AAC.14